MQKKRCVILIPAKMARRVLIEMIGSLNVLALWDSKENYVRVCNPIRFVVKWSLTLKYAFLIGLFSHLTIVSLSYVFIQPTPGS